MKEIRSELPQGQNTRNSFFYSLKIHGGRVGYLWLARHGEDTLFVAYLYVFAKRRAKGYGKRSMRWVESHARRLRCRRIRLHVHDHNASALDLYQGIGYTPYECWMQRTLPPRKSPPRTHGTPKISVRTVSKREFATFMRALEDDHTRQYARAHSLSSRQARNQVVGWVRNILPQRSETPGSLFYTISSAVGTVGYLWLGKWERTRLHVPYIYILKSQRSKGYGLEAMSWTEKKARLLGFRAMYLYVLEHNTVALGLFTKAGFSRGGTYMRKTESRHAPASEVR